MNGNTSPERIHVLHAIGSLRTGGAEKMLVNLLRAADKENFRYTVLCISVAGELAAELEGTGVAVEVYPVRFRHFPRDIFHLARWMRREKVQVVHSHMYFATVWSHLAAWLAGVPLRVTTEHGKELWKNRFQILVGRVLSRSTYRHVAVSEDIRDIRISRHGFAADKVPVIPNAVPVPPAAEHPEARARVRAEFGLAPSQPVVCTVGRVVDAKDYATMAAAVAAARKHLPDLHWLQVGDGPLLEDLVSEVSRLALDDAVTFAGRRSDIPDILRASDLWAMSSVREGLPVSLLEAMAERIPIVATDVGGIRDAVTHQDSAWLVPASDPGALAVGMVKLLEDRTLSGQLVDRAYAVVRERYSVQAVAEIICGVYLDGLGVTGD